MQRLPSINREVVFVFVFGVAVVLCGEPAIYSFVACRDDGLVPGTGAVAGLFSECECACADDCAFVVVGES